MHTGAFRLCSEPLRYLAVPWSYALSRSNYCLQNKHTPQQLRLSDGRYRHTARRHAVDLRDGQESEGLRTGALIVIRSTNDVRTC